MIRVKKENHRSWFMSNYYPCEFVMNGIRYKNAEAAFQSHKVPLEERKQFSDMPPATAKHFGRHVAFPANWDETRDDVMRNGNDYYIIDMALAENSALNDCVPKNLLRAYPQQWLPGESNS